MTKKTILTAGLIAALGMAPKTSAAQEYKSFDDFKKAKTEQFNKFAQQKKAEFDKFKQQSKASTKETKTEDAEVLQQVVPQHEMVTTGLGKPSIYSYAIIHDYNLEKASTKYHESDDHNMGTYVSDNGIAVVVTDNEQPTVISSGVLEDGQINYYTNISGKKEKCEDKEIIEFLNLSNQKYGNPNSAYSKALKMQNLRQRIQEKSNPEISKNDNLEKTNTLDLTSYFMQNGGSSRS